jgi:hypothetical protein
MATRVAKTNTIDGAGEVEIPFGALQERTTDARWLVGKLLSLLTRTGYTEKASVPGKRHRSVGVLPADWENMTNTATGLHTGFWNRLLRDGRAFDRTRRP